MQPLHRLLINSMPKSGTHLLTQVVSLLGYQDFGRHDGLWLRAKDKLGVGTPVVLAHVRVQRQWKRRWHALVGNDRGGQTIPIDVTLPVQVPINLAQEWLEAIPPGQFLSGHLPWTEATAQLLRTAHLKHLMIVRDPRDVLVSYLHFVTKPQHPLSKDFLSLSPDQRFHLALDGGPGPHSGRQIVGLRQAFASILEWQREPDVLITSFESLIGERGDGSGAAQRAAIRAICQYLEMDSDDNLIEHVCRHAFDTGAETFRRGKIGAWQDELSPDQIRLCNEGFAQILQDLSSMEQGGG